MAPNSTLTAWDAISALLPLIGAGGISSIIIAYLAYRKAALEGRRGDPDHAGKGITALLSDSGSIDNLALSMDKGALALDKIALMAIESKHDLKEKAEEAVEELRKIRIEFIDELRKLRQAVGDSHHG